MCFKMKVPYILTVQGLYSYAPHAKHTHKHVKQIFTIYMTQVSTHVALDHQTYSALDQHTQITWTAHLKCDEHSRVGRWKLGLHYIIIQQTYIDSQTSYL